MARISGDRGASSGPRPLGVPPGKARVGDGRASAEELATRQSNVSQSSGCPTCDTDAAFLRSSRPPYEALRPRVRIVDLFAGCGGLTLGAAEAARRLGMGIDVRLAVDFDSTATEVYRANLPGADVRLVRAEELFDGVPGHPLTPKEAAIRDTVGPLDVLLGGPPCQGHSDLNNHTRRADPRNALYLRMARAAEVLVPTIVLIENVPTVTRDTEKVVETTMERLRIAGYSVDDAVLDLTRLGAAQRRRRHVVLASRDPRVMVAEILKTEGHRCPTHPVRSLRWAIDDLVPASSDRAFDTAPSPSADNVRRIAWLFDNDQDDLPNDLRPPCHRSEHSYKSMYGRLKWDEPAQTVTTGFGSMGQGRSVHPSQRRTITPHEAARLQFLPDFWDFTKATSRGQLAMLIGNAAPPVLASTLIEPALRALGSPATVFPLEGKSRGAPSRRSVPSSRQPGNRPRAGVPAPSSLEARNRMRAVRRAGTDAELALRAAVDRLGMRYEVDAAIPGTRSRADLLFKDAGVVVLVDGCYWHGCPEHGTQAKANAGWWRDKLTANRERDAVADQRLHDMGWVVLRFWEHEDAEAAAKHVARIVSERMMLRSEPAVDASRVAATA